MPHGNGQTHRVAQSSVEGCSSMRTIRRICRVSSRCREVAFTLANSGDDRDGGIFFEKYLKDPGHLRS